MWCICFLENPTSMSSCEWRVHSQWAGRVFVYIHRRLRINQLIELRSKWNYGIYGTHQNGLFTDFFVGLWYVKLSVTLLHVRRCQLYSTCFSVGAYCTGDWKLEILIAICSWHSITSRIRKILVANASKLVAPYSTGKFFKSFFTLTNSEL